jgi:hypothetical protein
VLVDDLPDALFSLRRPAGAGPSTAVRAAVSGARAR